MTAYPAVRWVPAGVAYALIGRRAADLLVLGKNVADLLGLVGSIDADGLSSMSRDAVGYDLLSARDVQQLGLDVERGIAIFGTPRELTIAVAIADPARVERVVKDLVARVAAPRRDRGDGIVVLTVPAGHEIVVSWAQVDGWLLVHVAPTREQASGFAWLRNARLAGGTFASDADFIAATGLVDPRIATVAGVVRPDAVIEAMAMVGFGDAAATPCLELLGRQPRVLVSGGADAGGLRLLLAADLAAAEQVRELLVPMLAEWRDVRIGRPLQLDVGIDLPAAADALGPCASDIGLAAIAATSMRTVHLAADVHRGRLARIVGYADLLAPAWLHLQLHRIHGLSWFSPERTVGGLEVRDVDTPSFAFSYHLAPALAVVAAPGSAMRMMAKILNGGTYTTTELGHLGVDLRGISDEEWNLLQEYGLAGSAVRRLQSWERGEITIRLDDGALVVAASWKRAP